MSEEDRTADDAARARTARKRWITLGEVLAVAAVAISALTLWDSHQEWVRAVDREASASVREGREKAILVLRASPSRNGDRLTVTAADAGQAIQSQAILFPSAFGLAPIETAGDPRIDADWFDDPLKRALRAAGEREDMPGDRRLPVVITTTFVIGGHSHTMRALYDIGYVLEGRFLGGRSVVLRGLSLISTVSEKAMRARLDATWRQRHPMKEKHAAT